MKKNLIAVFFVILSPSLKSAPPMHNFNVENYLHEQGWKPYETSMLPKSPKSEIKPIIFYDKGNSVPSCGLISLSPVEEKPEFIELAGSDPGVGFPQCLNINSIIPFKVYDKEYLMVDYRVRETRDDIDHRFHYMVKNSSHRFVTDKAITDAAPIIAENGNSAQPFLKKSVDGVRYARIRIISLKQQGWNLLERDFISDNFSSFATLEDKKLGQCRFLTEAGGVPIVASQKDFSTDEKCDGILGSSRFEKGGKVYYLAMFRTSKRKGIVAVTSVAADRSVTIERALAAVININGTARDLKAAKTILDREVM